MSSESVLAIQLGVSNQRGRKKGVCNWRGRKKVVALHTVTASTDLLEFDYCTY